MDDDSLPAVEPDLADLTGLTLADLAELDDSVLGHALRRIIGDSAEPPIAGFDSRI